MKHISGYQKQRTNKEIIIRLSMINLIDEILLKGKISDERENVKYEGKFFFKSYKITYELNGIIFKVVIGQKNEDKYILLSCFSKIGEQKKDYQV